MEPLRLLSPEEVAPILGVSVRWFYGDEKNPSGASKAGLKRVKVGGRIKIRPSDLEEYLSRLELVTT